MAEIYIADKPTLDTVNAKMDAAVSTRAAQTTANTINTNIGSNADASSASGSVHAKLKDIKSAVGAVATLPKARSIIKGSFNTGNNVTPQTVLSLNGPGSLQLLACRKYDNTSSRDSLVKVILDGETLVYNKNNDSSQSNFLTVQSLISIQDGNYDSFRNIVSNYGVFPSLSLDFKTSLVIEMSYGTIYWVVSKE